MNSKRPDEPLETVAIDSQSLDGGGGISLSGLTGLVRIESDAVHAIDLVDCPELTGIDLSDCPDDLRIRLVRPEKLGWMRLPDGSAGSSVELELPKRFKPIQPLTIEGPVADFGICADWLVHPWRLDRPPKTPLESLFVGPPTAHPGSHRAAAHLLIGRAVRRHHLALDCRGIDRLMIMGAQISHLELNNAALSLLDINECRQLESITGHFQAGKARIAVCQKLERIGGSGQHLDLGCLHSAILDIEGHWVKTSMTACDTEQLELQRNTHLELASLPKLHTINAAEPYEMKLSHGMFATNNLAADLGSHPGKLDRFVREEMQRAGQRNEMATHWLEHIALEDNDLELYYRCRHLGITRPFRRLLESIDRIAPAFALAQALHANALPNSRLDECRRLLAGCLARLNLNHPDDTEAILGTGSLSGQPQGMIGRLRARKKSHLLPRLARVLISMEETELATRLARTVIEQLSEEGLVLIELGFEYARSAKPLSLELIAAGLGSGTSLPEPIHARAMRYLLREPVDRATTA